MPKSPDAVYRSVLLDKRSPVKLRLEALAAIARPSLNLLYTLTDDPSPKVRFAAAKQLEITLARKELNAK
jgi:hypothetical protein